MTKVLAKNPPPVWMLWAAGSVSTALLGFLCYVFTRNRARSASLSVRDGKTIAVAKYWSRFHKSAVIPIREFFSDEDFWGRKPLSDAMVVNSESKTKGPPLTLDCTFASARRGSGNAQLEPNFAPPTKQERFYLLVEHDGEEEHQAEFSLRAGRPSMNDFLILTLLSAAVIAAFFVFYLKIYPLY
jgi:hypothetical protein